jgi:Ca-activated chloride channel family protein
MKHRNLAFSILLGALALLFTVLLFTSDHSVNSQSRNRRVNANEVVPNDNRSASAPATQEVLKVDVDLVTIDALVLQKKTARMVGGLKKEDFLVYEDGTKQEITHFSQDTLPLSVLFLVDRGGCLDPFSEEVHRAMREATERLKPVDEAALMTYHDNTRLLQGFTKNMMFIEEALRRIPPHDEVADHCLNKLFADAADYMNRAGNPAGRRVIVVITGVTRNFDCLDGPSGKSAAQAIYESGSVVCAVVPKQMGQGLENGIIVWATRMGRLGHAPYIDIETLANETGGEILSDKPENLSTTFQTLMDHLRSRYNLAFVSTNKKRDGSTRKLKIDLSAGAQKSPEKLVVKARRSYVAPRS